jgi:mRNA interferase RelE/StbE
MRYDIELTPGAEEDLERLTIEMARRVSHLMDLIEDNPFGPPALALTGDLKGLHKLRAGDHRIVYRVNQSERRVLLIAIAPRPVVYGLALRRLRWE